MSCCCSNTYSTNATLIVATGYFSTMIDGIQDVIPLSDSKESAASSSVIVSATASADEDASSTFVSVDGVTKSSVLTLPLSGFCFYSCVCENVSSNSLRFCHKLCTVVKYCFFIRESF